MSDLARHRSLLFAALGFALLTEARWVGTARDRELRRWLDTWRGLGLVGARRQ